MEEKDKQIDKKQGVEPPEFPMVTLKIGELLLSAPILSESKYTIELIDIMIEKIKNNILEDKSFKSYISFIKSKQNSGSYLG